MVSIRIDDLESIIHEMRAALLDALPDNVEVNDINVTEVTFIDGGVELSLEAPYVEKIKLACDGKIYFDVEMPVEHEVDIQNLLSDDFF